MLIRNQYDRRKITDITDVTSVTDLIKNGIGMIMVGCSRCTYPSIHLSDSKSRSVVRGAVVCCVCMRVLCCVVCCVGVGVGVWWWCCVVWCVFLCLFVFFFSFFSQCSSFSFLLYLSFFLLSSSLSSLFSSFFSFSLLFSLPNTMERTDQPTRRPTSRHLNVIWRRTSAQQSVLSLLTPPLLEKKEETFYYRNISGEGIILHYSFILIQKNRRRVKLQSLRFYINSKTIKLQRVKSEIILAAMVALLWQNLKIATHLHCTALQVRAPRRSFSLRNWQTSACHQSAVRSASCCVLFQRARFSTCAGQTRFTIPKSPNPVLSASAFCRLTLFPRPTSPSVTFLGFRHLSRVCVSVRSHR